MKRSWFAWPYALWLCLFTIAPLLFVLYYAFTLPDGTFTFQQLIAFAQPTYLKILWHSLYLAFFCTLICLVLGYPAAYFLASKDFGRKKTLFVLFLLPMWMNFLLRTMAWQVILNKTGLLNTLLSTLGLPAVNIINTNSAIVFGMVYNYLPFMVLPLYNVMMKINDDVIEAAHDLGASRIT